MSRRGLLYGGVLVAGGAGYYLYQAGGDPKLAQSKAELDVDRAKAKLKSDEGAISEAEKKGEEWAKSAGKTIDRTATDARNKTNQADAKISAEVSKAGTKLDQFSKDATAQLDKTKKETGQNLNKAIDKFDETVAKKTSEAKSGISSWFGGGK